MVFLVAPGTGNLCVTDVVVVCLFMGWPGVKRLKNFSASTVLPDTEKGHLLSGHGITTMNYGVKNAHLIILLWTGWNLKEDIPGRRMSQTVEPLKV